MISNEVLYGHDYVTKLKQFHNKIDLIKENYKSGYDTNNTMFSLHPCQVNKVRIDFLKVFHSI